MVWAIDFEDKNGLSFKTLISIKQSTMLQRYFNNLAPFNALKGILCSLILEVTVNPAFNVYFLPLFQSVDQDKPQHVKTKPSSYQPLLDFHTIIPVAWQLTKAGSIKANIKTALQ